jgi:hypothetical protein
MINDYQERIVGTNIDPRSMLSTDYFKRDSQIR